MTDTYEHSIIPTNGINLHVVQAGEQDGTPLVLLHGFPEFWYGWHNQIDYFAERGYRVIIPDQRGYNLSDKPKKASDYHINELAKDIIGLLDHFGYETVYLGSHDWGAAVAWWLATLYPDRFRKIAILNVPHPKIIQSSLRKFNLKQLSKSWYIFFFQIPKLPEWISTRTGWWEGRTLKASSHKDTFSQDDIERYKEAWSQPGAITAMLNWYRANFNLRGSGFATNRPLKITVPILILWGEQDIALEKDLATQSLAICEDGDLVFFPNATHWVQHDEADAVNARMAEFFS